MHWSIGNTLVMVLTGRLVMAFTGDGSIGVIGYRTIVNVAIPCPLY